MKILYNGIVLEETDELPGVEVDIFPCDTGGVGITIDRDGKTLDVIIPVNLDPDEISAG